MIVLPFQLADKWLRLGDKEKEQWRTDSASNFEKHLRGAHGLATKFNDNSEEEIALFEVFLARIRYSFVASRSEYPTSIDQVKKKCSYYYSFPVCISDT